MNAVATSASNDQHRSGHTEQLTFVLGGDEFAVPIMKVKEIIEYCEVTHVPMMPSFIRGAINLRGSVVPVIDLAAKFGMPSGEVTRRSCIVIMELGDGESTATMGIVVDKVLQVVDVPNAQISPAPTFGARIRTDFIRGMGRIDDKFIIILDIDRVLSPEEITLVGSPTAEKPN